MKKLAVILPAYNAAAYLNQSIDSVLNQTFINFDLYVYDDCSTDNTEELISEYKDSRFFYRKNMENFGIAKTLNRGLGDLLPHYEYIARMDADDWCYPDRFQKQIAFLDENKEIVMCGTQGYWLKDMNENPESGWEYPLENDYLKYYLLFAASFGHSSIIFRSNPFQKYKIRYNETIMTCEDWDLWIRVVKIGKVANLPNYLMKYRILDNSNHRALQKNKTHLEERSKIISEYWASYNIVLSEELVYDYYYCNIEKTKVNFIKKIKLLIHSFNTFHKNNLHSLFPKHSKKINYLLARRILDYWKRSKVNRFNPILWIIIVREVTFMSKIEFIKSIIR